MEKFVELGVSSFDADFTLDPYPYLEDLYRRDDVLGFKADGMNFVFRFTDGRDVIKNPGCRREPLANPEIEARERVYAERYPNRAKNFAMIYPAVSDFRLKRLFTEFLDHIAEAADFSGANPVFAKLAAGGRLDDYIAEIRTLPLRVLLETSGLPFTEEQLADLNCAGNDFLKALDNFVDETPLKAADQAIASVWRYVEEHLERAPTDSPIRKLMDDGRNLGVSEEAMVVNIAAFAIVSLSNTAGISSGYLLRNLIRYPDARKQLQEQPERIQRDQTIMEFLRRDNHVKSLSRQVHEDFALRSFPMQKGESVNLFFPGINLDPTHWDAPSAIDLDRTFTGLNNVVFGGSVYMCIGKNLGLSFLKHIAGGLVANLPESARVVEDEVEVDGDWVAERIITKMPIVLSE